MARPRSEGLEYFPHDVDASNDEKIESMEAIYGPAGYAFYFKLVERVYRAGGSIDVSEAETRQILSRKCLATVEEWEKMLATAMRIGLFDAEEYKTNRVLTSGGIKRRCEKVFEKRAKSSKISKKLVSAAETHPETPESKVKESKVKESKVKESKEEKRSEKKESAFALEDVFFQNPDFLSAWNGWVESRNKSKPRLTDLAKKLNLSKLKELAGDDVNLATRIVNQTIESGWKGFFPLKEDDHGKAANPGRSQRSPGGPAEGFGPRQAPAHAKAAREFPERLEL